MISVALVVGRLNVGGAEAELARLARGLDRSRFAPFVVTLLDRGPLADSIGDVELVELGRRRKWTWGTWRALRDLLRERKPDVVQSFLFTENVFCRRAGVGAVVSGIQGWVSDASETGPWPKVWLERRTFPLARAAVSNSAYYRDAWARLGMDASKIEVVPSSVELPARKGIDVRRELGIGRDEFVVGVIARLVERKGHEDLLAAAAPGVRLLFVGDGPMRPRLEGRGAVLAGWRRDVADVLDAVDAVAVPSRHGEGCPNAALEAMAAGKPVLGARSGGIPEVVEDGATGLLVGPGGWGEALGRLRDDAALRARLGEEGRRRARERHAPGAMAASYGRLYLKLTGGGSSL
jgi:glycosyltransferase involved in cell wall biosynthesis